MPKRDTDSYALRVINEGRCEVVLTNVAMRLRSGVARLTKTFGRVPNMVGVYECEARQTVQDVFAVNPQKLHALICDNLAWRFSIAFDAAANHGNFFVDVRASLSVKELKKDFYFLTFSSKYLALKSFIPMSSPRCSLSCMENRINTKCCL